MSPELAAQRLAEHAQRGPVALVFGGEKRGLSDDELALCHDVTVIPTDPLQPSMNLSQAVAVMLYLCARAFADPKPPAAAGTEKANEAAAKVATLRALEERLGKVLLRAEFLNPQAPEHVLSELARSLARASLSQREAEMWLSAFAHVERKLT
jgi:tRNA/rRNA methyltransferase